jgi:putative ABC transport system permease protein
LLLALLLAVGSLSTVGLFADRVRQALQQQAQSLIGADLRITSTRPLPDHYRELAQAHGLQTVLSLTFPSMVLFGEQSLLGEIQAVEAGYPLRGKIEIDEGSTVEARSKFSTPSLTLPLSGGGNVDGAVGAVPIRGTIWVDDRLLRRLNIKLGDAVSIGKLRFTVAARIVKDIDQSIGFASFSPRVLLNAEDLAATGLQQEGSRISYRLMFAGEPAQVNALRDELKPQLSGNEKMEDVRDARPEIRTALERAESFLGLAALTAAILAGTAMALAAQRFVLRHLDSCAVMRCLGAQQDQVLRLFLYQFLLVGVLAVTIGCLLGYATQAGLVLSIESMRNAALPQPSLMPVLKAALSGFALLLGFTFLPLLQLRKASPLRVLRRELDAPQASTRLVYGLGILVLSGLFLWQAGSVKLGLVMLAGLLVGLLCFGLLAWILLRSLEKFAPRLSVHSRHAFANLARHARTNAMQIVALSLGGMALLLLTVVRGDLLQSWQGKLPSDTPNRFVVNIQPDQQQPFLDFFTKNNMSQPQLLPMVRGRLTAINDHPIDGDSYPDPRARGLVEREFNLSYMEQMPSWNTLVSGAWWLPQDGSIHSPFALSVSPSAMYRRGERGTLTTKGEESISIGHNQLSVEEGIAKTLQIKLGDSLTYDVAGTRFTAKVTNLRKVLWDSMKVNFFVIATPGLLKDAPVSYLTSFYLPPDKLRVGDALSREFSNLLVIDTGAMITQVQGIIEQISQTISVVFLFTLFSGIAVLYAALLATQDERSHEAAILRTLGASGAYIRKLHLSEFAVLGALSGLLAAFGAALLGWVLARFVLEIAYQLNPLVWLIGVFGGMAVVMLAAWLTTRRLTELPPLVILRE